MKQSRKALLDEIKPLLAKYSTLQKEIQEMKARGNAEVLKDRRVVGMTTTGAAQNQDLIRLVQYAMFLLHRFGSLTTYMCVVCSFGRRL